MKEKKVVDGEEVLECEGIEGKELAPADHILANSPRKPAASARSALASSRSSNRPLSVRIQEPNGFASESFAGSVLVDGVDVEEVEGEEVQQQEVVGVMKGKGLGDTDRARTPPESETARLTVVPSYTGGGGRGEGSEGESESRPPTAETQIINETGLSNPFTDAFTNLPETECTLPPPELLATSRTGVSDMSDSILETGRLTTGEGEGDELLKFNYKQKVKLDEGYLTAKPTKVKVAAASTLQSTWRRKLAVSIYKVKIREEEAKRKREAMKETEKEEESEDEEYNALVDENENLHVEKIKMTQTMERMRRELEELKGRVGGEEVEEVVEKHGKGNKKKK